MKKKELLNKYKYLIIGGTTKAATTSLFNYLADHIEICASSMKETRFFLDKEYPLSSKYRFTDGIDKYSEFFNHCSHSKIRLEATPDYLYSMGTPERIKKALPKAKILFILREPVSRLISWYNFAKQNNNMPKEMSFDEYIKLQQIYENSDNSNREQHMRALEQGKYSIYLKHYLEIFNQDEILVVFYEDLSENPLLTMKVICNFAGIDCEFYNGYDFKVFNPTEKMRNPQIHTFYKSIKYTIRKYIHNRTLIHSILKRIKSTFEPFYISLNTRSKGNIHISQSLDGFLKTYYNEEAYLIKALTGSTVPWKRWS